MATYVMAITRDGRPSYMFEYLPIDGGTYQSPPWEYRGYVKMNATTADEAAAEFLAAVDEYYND